MTNPPVGVDSSVLADLMAEVGGFDTGGGDLIAVYLEDADQRMVELRAAVDADDSTVIAQAAHGLRSSSALVGALRLSELLTRCETTARAGASDLRPLALEIEAEYVAVSADLRQLQLSS
jgi:HPt (histidine-containing phosphotransfer) domain-containing protein